VNCGKKAISTNQQLKAWKLCESLMSSVSNLKFLPMENKEIISNIVNMSIISISQR
jgi:hypothetical protein